MGASRYEVLINECSHFVKHGDTAFLGAYGSSFWRSWVYPFYTPSGRTVVENFPFDHPFHNGIFVGQNPVTIAGRTANFWALPVKRSHDDHIMSHIGRMDPQGTPHYIADDSGVCFSLKSVWRDEHDEPVLDEKRSVTMRALPDAHICDMASTKTASYGETVFNQTKFGSIGARVEPRLLPTLGGLVIGYRDGKWHRGLADEVANLKTCDAVAYENDVPGIGIYGICLLILENSADPGRQGPWFIRDYGMAMFNATQNAAILVPAGNSWAVTLRVVAYDGPLSAARLSEWR